MKLTGEADPSGVSDEPLQGGDDLFREMANGLPLIVWVHDAAGRQVMVNDTFCEFFGVSRAEMKGGSWQVLMHPEDSEAYASEFFACVRDRRPFHGEVRVRRADGEWRWIESWGRPRFDAGREFRGFVGTSADITDRKLTEASLRQLNDEREEALQHIEKQHAQLRAIYDAIADALVVLDMTGVAVFVNEAQARLFGAGGAVKLQRDAAFPAELFELTDPGGAPLPRELWPSARVLRGERLSNLELVVRRRDTGQSWLINFAGEPVYDGQGRQILGVLVSRDVSEPRQREQALRESEERYRNLFGSIDEGFCVLEMIFDADDHPVDYRFLETNPAFERYTGLVGAVGKTARELVPDLEAHWAEVYGRVARTGEPYRFALGSEAMNRYFEVAASRVGAPEDQRVALLFTDTTERTRTERALRDSEERFRTLADNMSQFAWMADENGLIFWYNQRWYDFTGTQLEEVQGWRWTKVLHPDHAERVVQRLQRSWATGEPWEDVFPIRDKDGHFSWFLSRALPIHDSGGKIIRWFGTHTDVTRQRQAEEQLRESDRRKDEYLAMLGHELRNPLAAIQSATDLVKLITAEDPRLRRASAVLERQSAHMARLIEGLLEVSRIARGKVSLDLQTVDVREVVMGVVEDRGAQLAERRLELEKHLPSAPLWALADPVRLAQVLDNLLGNSLKFTKAPGRITVLLEQAEGRALIRVRDTGVGIRPEKLTEIFEPFHQEQQNTERGSDGLGLGLALAKGLVELHQGTIEARSAGLGFGAEFLVRLPLAERPLLDPEAQPKGASAARKILIVEDNLDAAEMLLELLRARGHAASISPNGAEALKQLRSERHDLVLCDIGLPGGLSGYDFAGAVRADAALRDLPLVAVTGYGQPEDRARTARAGFDAHLTKPVSLQALSEVIERLGAARTSPPEP